MNTERRFLLTSVPLLVALIWPGSAQSAGFAISEWGASALGMANATTALADRPSAVVFNPAGLAQLDGLTFQAGVTLIAPSFGYTLPAPGSTSSTVDVFAERQFFPVPALYASYRLHRRVSVGIGAYSAYGLGIKWPSSVEVPGRGPMDWWGRDLVQEVDLQTFYVSPTVSVKINDRVYLGAGLNIVQAAVFLRRAVTFSASADDDVTLELSGDDMAFSANAGLLLKVIPKLVNVGLTYRGGYSLRLAGKAAFTKAGGAVPDALRSRLVDGPGGALVNLPHVFSLGVAAFPTERLTLGFALDVTTWSSYKELKIEFFEQPDLTTSELKNYRNTIALRLGAEYDLLPNLPLRVGFVFDQSPVPKATVGPELPDGDRYELSFGVGYRRGDLTVDLAYLFLLTGDNTAADTAPLVGTYRASAHLLALSLGYKLDY